MAETHARRPNSDSEKRQALVELMAIPDTPDLRRRHHLTLAGRSDRHLILPRLIGTFVQYHLVEMEEREAGRERL